MIKLLVLDIDGIMTVGNKLYDRSGFCCFKFFNDKDWTAIKLFKCHNINVCFLTGDDFNLDIAKNRNIDCFLNKESNILVDKVFYLDILCDKYNVTPTEIAYLGDDYFDYNILKAVKYHFVPEDAPVILKESFNVMPFKGGENLVMKFYEYCLVNNLIPDLEIQTKIDLLYDFDKKEKF
mgnify:CR=1 FL=1